MNNNIKNKHKKNVQETAGAIGALGAALKCVAHHYTTVIENDLEIFTCCRCGHVYCKDIK